MAGIELPPAENCVTGTDARCPWPSVVKIAIVLVFCCGLALRFWTRSALWLDEALTVDIARLPVSAIPSYLKRDGSPPLYYVLLHYWMDVFGQSDVAVRALAGIFSVATMPVAWSAAKRLAGRAGVTDGVATIVAWVSALLLASSPFAVYYATEARMYSLVMFLSACGVLLVARLVERVRMADVVLLAVVGAALLYTQYWALYLMGSFGIWLLWHALRGAPERRRAARWMLAAMVVSGIAFLPWVPTFVYQAQHTGTPWAKPANFSAVIGAITGFTDNQATLSHAGSNQGIVLAAGYFVLGALGIFGAARSRWSIELDVRGKQPGRTIGFVVGVTLVAAAAGGILSSSAFSPRYASVVLVLVILLVGFGTVCLADATLRLAVVAVLVIAGFGVGVENIWTQRTQAPQVAEILAARAHRGDLVVLCPDQLGPSVYRYFDTTQTDRSGQHGRFDMVTFPRGIGPAFVDWVTYLKVVRAANPADFADQVAQTVGASNDIWLVSAPGYQGFGNDCEALAGDLGATVGYSAHTWVAADPATYYEPMSLIEFSPVHASVSPVRPSQTTPPRPVP